MDFEKERLMMSKEETRKRAKELLNENQADLITKYMFLEQQVKKQKEVIDKIKDLLIIKKSRCLNEDDYILNVLDLDEILDVLNEALECNK